MLTLPACQQPRRYCRIGKDAIEILAGLRYEWREHRRGAELVWRQPAPRLRTRLRCSKPDCRPGVLREPAAGKIAGGSRHEPSTCKTDRRRAGDAGGDRRRDDRAGPERRSLAWVSQRRVRRPPHPRELAAAAIDGAAAGGGRRVGADRAQRRAAARRPAHHRQDHPHRRREPGPGRRQLPARSRPARGAALDPPAGECLFVRPGGRRDERRRTPHDGALREGGGRLLGAGPEGPRRVLGEARRDSAARARGWGRVGLCPGPS